MEEMPLHYQIIIYLEFLSAWLTLLTQYTYNEITVICSIISKNCVIKFSDF